MTNPYEIDWAAIKAHQGRIIEFGERHRVELAVLVDQTDALVHRGDWVRRMNQITQEEIGAAHLQDRTCEAGYANQGESA